MNIKGKIMNSEVLLRKALSACLTVALLATYSMTTLAGAEKIAGQLSISGKNANGETPVVKVNGKAMQNGGSIYSSSTIATPEDASAAIDLGKVGKVELAPKTTLALTFGEKGINGDLLAGQVTVLSASQSVSITTPDGKTTKLNAGESLAASKAQDDDEDERDGGAAWGIWLLILGGAVAAIIIAATRNDNRTALGGGVVVASPSR